MICYPAWRQLDNSPVSLAMRVSQLILDHYESADILLFQWMNGFALLLLTIIACLLRA